MRHASAVIRCPLCDLPHLAVATICDRCEQPLNQRPNIEEIEEEFASRRRKIFVAAVVIAGMLAINMLVGRHVGGFVLLVAPIGWLCTSWVRYSVLKKRLALLRTNPPTS